jgi:hypothetical protein
MAELKDARTVALFGNAPKGITLHRAGDADILRPIHSIASRTSTNIGLFQLTILSRLVGDIDLAQSRIAVPRNYQGAH